MEEVKNSEETASATMKKREHLLKELQGLTDTLEEIYQQNVQLDKENALLRNEVRAMRTQVDNIVGSMKMLQEDLRKAYDIIRESRGSRSRGPMEDLKRKVKNLVPEHKHLEIDNIFREWIARLKAHVEGYEEPQWRKNEGSSRDRREHLQRQIDRLTRPRTKVLRESDTSTTDLTLAEMEEDFGKVRDGILRIRLNLNKPKPKEGESENVELIRKLQEVKRFLEKLT